MRGKAAGVFFFVACLGGACSSASDNRSILQDTDSLDSMPGQTDTRGHVNQEAGALEETHVRLAEVPVAKGCLEMGRECGTFLSSDGTVFHCGKCEDDRFCNAAGLCMEEPDCSIGFFIPRDVNINGQGETAVVQPGAELAIVFNWTIANSTNCSNCSRQVAVGVEEGSFACVDIGMVGNCPEAQSGYALANLLAPLDPGEYAVILEAPQYAECGGVNHQFGTDIMAVQSGTLIVTEACKPQGCAKQGIECDEWDDGCGGRVWCGFCPMGEVCDEGKCRAAQECELDIFDVSDILINGFINAAQVSVGHPVYVLFKWKLGSSDENSDKKRQIVLGMDNSAVMCIEVGESDSCPNWDTGLASGTFTAPPHGGIYTLYAAATAQQDCQEAMAVFAETQPRLAVGSLHVIGQCQTLSCAARGVECGLAPNGCAGLVDCGACPSSQYCLANGKCASSIDCSAGWWELTFKEGILSGEPVAAGSMVPVVMKWKAISDLACPGCPRKLVLGYDGTGAACFDLGPLPACPGEAQGEIGGFMKAPPFTGVYFLESAVAAWETCDDALASFPSTLKRTSGMLTVEGRCLSSSCEAMGKECGEWEDGCGNILHCGVCGPGSNCTSQGKCKGECDEGLFDISAVSINGSGKMGSSAPGKSVQVSLSWKLGNPPDCAGCKRQVVVGYGKEPGFCVDAGVPPLCPDYTTGSKTGILTTPKKEGDHTVLAAALFAPDCPSAMKEFAGAKKVWVGSLHVHSGCNPVSCLEMGKECGSWDDSCGFSLDCGNCTGGQICNKSGHCYCSADDPFEPNDSASNAYYFGKFTDKDVESQTHLQAAVEDEEDWFKMDALDVIWAYMEPFIQVTPGANVPLEVMIFFVCTDGQIPKYNIITASGCELKDSLAGVKVPNVSGPLSGFQCKTSGFPVSVQFGPGCVPAEDSGTLYVGIKGSGGKCSGYDLSLHL